MYFWYFPSYLFHFEKITHYCIDFVTLLSSSNKWSTLYTVYPFARKLGKNLFFRFIPPPPRTHFMIEARHFLMMSFHTYSVTLFKKRPTMNYQIPTNSNGVKRLTKILVDYGS